MTLAEIRGGVIMRLGPRERIPIPAVDIEIHNAIDDIRGEAKKLGVESLDRVAYLNAPANSDIYNWPDEADEIRDVFFLGAGATPVPMSEVGMREASIADWVGFVGYSTPFTWTQLPNRRLRVLNKTSNNVDNALMVRFFPGQKRMVKPDDEPNLPRAVHENIIPGAIMRMASYDGIGLAHPRSFEMYRILMQLRLEVFMNPDSVGGSGNQIQDIDPYYNGGS